MRILIANDDAQILEYFCDVLGEAASLVHVERATKRAPSRVRG